MVAILGPESDLDWICGCYPVQLTPDRGRFIEMDRVEANSVSSNLTVTANVRASFIVIDRKIP